MAVYLRFLADMNLSPVTVVTLQRDGWDIVRVSSLLPAYASDTEVLALARQQDRVVVTQDLDFSVLLALGGLVRPSLITIRMSNTEPKHVATRLLQILPRVAEVLADGAAVTVDDNALRIRRLPIR